jgi:hypothetical protein
MYQANSQQAHQVRLHQRTLKFFENCLFWLFFEVFLISHVRRQAPSEPQIRRRVIQCPAKLHGSFQSKISLHWEEHGLT